MDSWFDGSLVSDYNFNGAGMPVVLCLPMYLGITTVSNSWRRLRSRFDLPQYRLWNLCGSIHYSLLASSLPVLCSISIHRLGASEPRCTKMHQCSLHSVRYRYPKLVSIATASGSNLSLIPGVAGLADVDEVLGMLLPWRLTNEDFLRMNQDENQRKALRRISEEQLVSLLEHMGF